MEEKEVIVVGRKYTLRNGLITQEIQKSSGNSNYVFEAKVKEPQHKDFSILYWKRNGKALTDSIEHKHDIILKGWD